MNNHHDSRLNFLRRINYGPVLGCLLVVALNIFSTFSVAETPQSTAVATGVDAYSAQFSPPISSYVVDQIYQVKFLEANTTQFNAGPETTIDIDGLGAVAIKKIDYSGKSRILTNDITPGHVALLWYDGTDMVLLNPALPSMMAKTRADGTYIGLLYGGHDFYGDWDPVLYISSNAVNGNARIDNTKPSITLALEGGYRQSPGGPILQEWNLDTVRADGTPERWLSFANHDIGNVGEHAFWYRNPGSISFRKYNSTDTSWDEVGTFHSTGFTVANNYRLSVGNDDAYFFRYDGYNFYLATKYGTGVVYSVATAAPTMKLGMGIARSYKEIMTTPYQALDIDDVILVNTLAGGIVVKLPYPWPVPGKELTIKDNDGSASTNNIVIDAGAGRLIDGERTKLINADWGAQKVIWNNSRQEWRIVP